MEASRDFYVIKKNLRIILNKVNISMVECISNFWSVFIVIVANIQEQKFIWLLTTTNSLKWNLLKHTRCQIFVGKYLFLFLNKNLWFNDGSLFFIYFLSFSLSFAHQISSFWAVFTLEYSNKLVIFHKYMRFNVK